MRGKCERGHSFSTPGLRFHGVDRAAAYYNICVRASRCGKCALNPLTSHPIPPPKAFTRPRTATRPSRALPLPSRSADAPPRSAMHSPPTSQPIPRRRPSPAPAQRHTLPSTSAPPRSPDPHPQAARCTPADLTTHFPPKTSSRPRTATRPPQALPLPHAAPMHARRLRDAFPTDRTTRSSPKAFASPTQRHAHPEHFRPPRSADARPLAARCIPRRPHNPFLAEGLCPPPLSDTPSRALLLPHAAPTHARRLRDAFLAALTAHSPQRHAASPSVLLRTQKNGTAQCMCDAECLGRPSLRSVIWVVEPRAVRRRCGALACRRGA